jgi:hypothetical protein
VEGKTLNLIAAFCIMLTVLIYLGFSLVMERRWRRVSDLHERLLKEEFAGVPRVS